MTNNKILWIHDKALRTKNDISAIFIWDDNYFKSRRYTLKRLIFIYEALLGLSNIKILKGDTLEILSTFDKVYALDTADSIIRKYFKQLPNLKLVHEISFAKVAGNYKRFFKYWNEAKETAFKIDGR